jgi:hypothetical protein
LRRGLEQLDLVRVRHLRVHDFVSVFRAWRVEHDEIIIPHMRQASEKCISVPGENHRARLVRNRSSGQVADSFSKGAIVNAFGDDRGDAYARYQNFGKWVAWLWRGRLHVALMQALQPSGLLILKSHHS